MYATWPCPLSRGGQSEEMVLGLDRQRAARVLVIPPLFEEANKFRRQLVEIVRLLDTSGIDAFIPDLPGWNESLQPHRDQTLQHWRIAVRAAITHFGATHALGIRSGSWLVPQGFPGWVLAPPAPRKVLRAQIRALALARREAGVAFSSQEAMEQALKHGFEVGGWQIGPALVKEMDRDDIPSKGGQILITQEDIGGSGLWLRAENDFDRDQAQALVARMKVGLESR